MSERTTEILSDATRLRPAERAIVTERLLSSLDHPDPRIDALWAIEAEHRIVAYDAGRMEAFSAEEVFAELEQS